MEENKELNVTELSDEELELVFGGYRASAPCPNYKKCHGYVETIGGVTYCSVCGKLN